jgi:anti-sigma B factor antagonist
MSVTEDTMREPAGAGRSEADQPLTIAMSDLGPETILCVLSGDIDAATGPRLQQELTEAVAERPAHLVIDLSGIEFMGSAGLKILTEIHAAQQDVGSHLAIAVGHNRAAVRPIQVTELDQLLDIHTEQASAVEACHARPRRA